VVEKGRAQTGVDPRARLLKEFVGHIGSEALRDD
jgi:hypothetical protein